MSSYLLLSIDRFLPLFIQVRLLDIIDILLVAFLLYYLYKLIRGTGALNIFLGIISVYVFWWLVRIFEMELLTEILGQFISVGVLALIVVFQPEIRKFLLILGTRGFLNENSRFFVGKFWPMEKNQALGINELVASCEQLSATRTGALIVLARENNLETFVETGELIEARLSTQLLGSIFYKNSPLHDGAVIIVDNKIKAARCVLPVSENALFPVYLGLRHRAALGITEESDSIAIVVSEQTGNISLMKDGEIKGNIKPVELKEMLVKEFTRDIDKSKS